MHRSINYLIFEQFKKSLTSEKLSEEQLGTIEQRWDDVMSKKYNRLENRDDADIYDAALLQMKNLFDVPESISPLVVLDCIMEYDHRYPFLVYMELIKDSKDVGKIIQFYVVGSLSKGYHDHLIPRGVEYVRSLLCDSPHELTVFDITKEFDSISAVRISGETPFYTGGFALVVLTIGEFQKQFRLDMLGLWEPIICPKYIKYQKGIKVELSVSAVKPFGSFNVDVCGVMLLKKNYIEDGGDALRETGFVRRCFH